MTETTYSRSAELMEADVGRELVALDVEAGTCFGFNEVATTVWRLLEEPKSAGQICSALLEEYEVEAEECRREVAALLENLVSRGLLTVR